MSDHSNFKISYIGPALETHQMDVRDLAPAMLALAELFDRANAITFGEKQKVNLRVKALNAGSFEVDFVLSGAQQIWDIFKDQDAQAAIKLVELMFGGFSVLSIIKFLKGRNADKIEKLPDQRVSIEFAEQTLVVQQNVYNIYTDVNCRQSFERVALPLATDGIEQIAIQTAVGQKQIIEKDELSGFIVGDSLEEVLQEITTQNYYTIVSLAFKDDNKWRLNDGQSTISVLIKDEEFLHKVDASEVAFAKNDTLFCEVLQRQLQTSLGLKKEHIVLKVLEHRPALKQMRLL